MGDPWDNARNMNSGFRMRRYSATEIRDLTIAILVLSVAFLIILGDSRLYPNNVVNYLALFGISLVLVLTSFMLHELAHKIVAQRYGAWAEFRMYPFGLLIALVFSTMGFLFAAPGAVYIDGAIDEERNGKISAAGPMVNIIIGSIATLMWFMTDGLTSQIFGLFALLNAFFAAFNLLPIAPMDGSKIYGWNMPLYIGMFAVAAALLILQFLY